MATFIYGPFDSPQDAYNDNSVPSRALCYLSGNHVGIYGEHFKNALFRKP